MFGFVLRLFLMGLIRIDLIYLGSGLRAGLSGVVV